MHVLQMQMFKIVAELWHEGFFLFFFSPQYFYQIYFFISIF